MGVGKVPVRYLGGSISHSPQLPLGAEAVVALPPWLLGCSAGFHARNQLLIRAAPEAWHSPSGARPRVSGWQTTCLWGAWCMAASMTRITRPPPPATRGSALITKTQR